MLQDKMKQSVEVRPLLQELRRGSLDLNSFLADVRKLGHSGEARISTLDERIRILFYQGSPFLSSGRNDITVQEALQVMDSPDSSLSFFLLGDELVHSFSSVLNGEPVWESLSMSLIQHLDNMLKSLMEKGVTGHICVYKEDGARHYLFFYSGDPLGAYEIENNWRPIDISLIWNDATHLDHYRSFEMETLLGAAEGMISPEEFVDFISSWNELVERIARRTGRKPVEKSLVKNFGGLEPYSVQGIRLQLSGEKNTDIERALKDFRQAMPGFFREMKEVMGGRLLERELLVLKDKKGELVEKFSLTDLFPGGPSR